MDTPYETLHEALRTEVERLTAFAEAQGAELRAATDAVALYASQRAELLRVAAGEPGWEEAVTREARNVAAFAGITVVDVADRLDATARLVYVEAIRSVIAIAARALALAA